MFRLAGPVLAGGFLAGCLVSRPPPQVADPFSLEGLPADIGPQEPARVDAYGDPMPRGGLIRIGSPRFSVRRRGEWRGLCRYPHEIAESGAVSEDHTLLACGYRPGFAIVERLPENTKLWKLWDHDTGITNLAISRNGGLAATATYRKLVLWNLSSGTLIRKRELGLAWPVALAFSQEGDRIALLEENGCLSVLGAPGLKPLRRVEQAWPGEEGAAGLYRDSVWLDWTPGVLAIATAERVVTIDPLDWKIRTSGPVHTAIIESIVFAPDGGHLVTLDRRKRVGLWDARTGDSLGFGDLPAERLALEGVQRADGLSGRYGQGLVRAGEPVRKVAGLDIRPGLLLGGLSADGTTLVVQLLNDGRLEVWDLRTGKRRCRAQRPAGMVGPIAVSRDGRTVTYGVCRDLVWLDGRTCEPLRGAVGFRAEVSSLDFSPDGRHLAVGGFDSRLRVLRVPDGRQVAVFEGHQGPVSAIAFSPDGARIASGSFDSSILVWDFPAGRSAGADGR